MLRAILIAVAACLAASTAQPQSEDTPPDNRTILGAPINPALAAGAVAIRGADYEEGIRLTLQGLGDAGVTARDRAAALSNLCAAYAALNLPDTAIRYCTDSLAINDKAWQAYSNRSYAYWLKGQYADAKFDLDAAMALSPRARQVGQIRGMINEARLEPRITMEDLQ